MGHKFRSDFFKTFRSTCGPITQEVRIIRAHELQRTLAQQTGNQRIRSTDHFLTSLIRNYHLQFQIVQLQTKLLLLWVELTVGDPIIGLEIDIKI